MKYLSILAVISITAFFNTVHAQNDTLAATEKLSAVTVSSAYTKSSKVVVPTTKISAERITNTSTKDLVSTLNLTPGVFIQSGAINTNRITIRGVGSRTLYGTNKIRAYLDGIPITNGVGDTSIDVYNPQSIGSIEVVKGPKATQYGTNLGGTLLLNTPTLSSGTQLQNQTTVGSFGLFKNSTSFQHAAGKVQLNFNYGHLQQDGFRANSNFNRNTYLLTAKYAMSAKQELTLLVNQIDYTAQIPSSIGRTAFENNPESAAFTWGAAKGYEANSKTLVGLSHTLQIDASFSNTTSVFYTYLDHYEPRPFNILDEMTNGYGARTMFAKNLATWAGNTVLSFGAEWYKDEYQWKTLENLYESNQGNGSLAGELLSDNEEYRNSLSTFATLTMPLTSKLKAEVGVNVNTTRYAYQDELNTGEANTSANRDFKTVVAPNFSMVYSPNAYLQWYANVSNGFNYPTLEETLTPEGMINPEIGPEKGWNYEVGTKLYAAQQRLQVEASAYILDIRNLLVANRVGDNQYVGRNAGRTLHRGIELAAQYQWQPNTQWRVVPFINSTFNFHKFDDFVDADTNYSGNTLTGVPDVQVNSGLNIQHHSGVYMYTTYNYIGTMPINDANTLYSDAYSLLNIRLGYQSAQQSHWQWHAFAGVNNVTNTHYASSILINATAFGTSEPRYYYPGEPVNYYGSVGVRYVF